MASSDAHGDEELAKLLAEQAAFLKSAKPPAAKVMRGAPPKIRSNATAGQSGTSYEPLLPVLNPDAAPPPRPKTPPPAHDGMSFAELAPIMPPVVTEILEREPVVSVPISAPFQRRTGGFPRAMHRSSMPAEASARLRGVGAAASAPPTSDSTSSADDGANGARRGGALGASVATAIHSENSKRLQGMSPAEIKKAQDELRAALDPSLVARIQQRSKASGQQQQQQQQRAPTGTAPTPMPPPAQQPPKPPQAPPSAMPPPAESTLPFAARSAAPASAPGSRGTQPPAAAAPGASLTASLTASATAGATAGATASLTASATAGATAEADAKALERLKMEWMGEAEAEAPEPPDAGDGKRTAEEAIEAATRKLGMHHVRFDLQGKVVDAARAEAIGVREGLHHHGDAPAAPGYTLAELTHLSRSAVPAQRAQALVAFAGVLREAAVQLQQATPDADRPGGGGVGASAGTGGAGSRLHTGRAVVHWCRDADVALLLRLSLDDMHASCVHASLEACEALAEAMAAVESGHSRGGLGPAGSVGGIVSDCARAAAGWRGCEGVFGLSKAASKAAKEARQNGGQSAGRGASAVADGVGGDDGVDVGGGAGGDESSGETDAEVCRRDLVEGWVRTGMAGRLRFLLDADVHELTPAGRAHALALLCRFAHRSAGLANTVARTPHLLDALRSQLERPDDDGTCSSEEAAPTLRLALTLVQLLAASSRGTCQRLLEANVLPACNALLAKGFRFGGALTTRANAANAAEEAADAAVGEEAKAAARGADLAARVLGLWRCCAAYALSEPPLGSMFELFAQAVGTKRGPAAGAAGRDELAGATFGLLETLCHLPLQGRVGVLDWSRAHGAAAVGVGATMAAEAAAIRAEEEAQAAAREAQPKTEEELEIERRVAEEAAAEAADVADRTQTPRDASLVGQLAAEQQSVSAPAARGAAEGDTPPAIPDAGASDDNEADDDEDEEDGEGRASGRRLLAGAGAGSRWRFLAAYVPAALAALERTDPPRSHLPLAAAAAHFLASYLSAVLQLQPSLALPLIPWCEQLASRFATPLAQGSAFALAADTLHGPASPLRELCESIDCLSGYARLCWQLSRAHRGLLAGWQKAGGEAGGEVGAGGKAGGKVGETGVRALLWVVADRLPRALGVAFSLTAATAPPSAASSASPAASSASSASSSPLPLTVATALLPGQAAEATTTRDTLLSAAGRLAYFTAMLIDALESTDAAAGQGAPLGAIGSDGAGPARRMLSLVLCGASWLRSGDELMCRELLASIASGTRWLKRVLMEESPGLDPADAQAQAQALRAALLPPFAHLTDGSAAAEADAKARAAPDPSNLSSLRRAPAASALPLPPDWLCAPLHRFERGMPQARIAAQVAGGLRLLALLLRAPCADPPPTPLLWVAPSRLLCRGLAVFGMAGSCWQDEGVRSGLDDLWHLTLLSGTVSPRFAPDPRRRPLMMLGHERGVDVQSMLQEVLQAYAADSYGDAVFTRWVLLGLRAREPRSVRMAVWVALEELATKMTFDVLPRDALPLWARRAATAAAAAEEAATEGAEEDGEAEEDVAAEAAHELEELKVSLAKGRLAHAGGDSFLRRLAEHHVEGKPLA